MAEELWVGQYRMAGLEVDCGGSAPEFCMFHKRGLLPLPPVEHTKPRSYISVSDFAPHPDLFRRPTLLIHVLTRPD